MKRVDERYNETSIFCGNEILGEMSLYLNRFYEEYDKIKEKNYIYNYKIEKNEGIAYRVVHEVPEDHKKLIEKVEFINKWYDDKRRFWLEKKKIWDKYKYDYYKKDEYGNYDYRKKHHIITPSMSIIFCKIEGGGDTMMWEK